MEHKAQEKGEEIMQILIDRKWKKKDYTISNVYVNGERFSDGKQYCNALEDTDRGLKSTMSIEDIKKKKVYGKTAIPSGTYNVIRTYSYKFGRYLPLIENVRGFSGIRIHSGNTADDSLGCLLIGRNDKVGWISNSRYWFNLLDRRIQTALGRKEKVTIKIL